MVAKERRFCRRSTGSMIKQGGTAVNDNPPLAIILFNSQGLFCFTGLPVKRYAGGYLYLGAGWYRIYSLDGYIIYKPAQK